MSKWECDHITGLRRTEHECDDGENWYTIDQLEEVRATDNECPARVYFYCPLCGIRMSHSNDKEQGYKLRLHNES